MTMSPSTRTAPTLQADPDTTGSRKLEAVSMISKMIRTGTCHLSTFHPSMAHEDKMRCKTL